MTKLSKFIARHESSMAPDITGYDVAWCIDRLCEYYSCSRDMLLDHVLSSEKNAQWLFNFIRNLKDVYSCNIRLKSN